MRYVLHKFRPTETIDAVLRLKGRHNYEQSEIIQLRRRFNELNGEIVPHPGDVYKIPLEALVTDDFGDVVAAVQSNVPMPEPKVRVDVEKVEDPDEEVFVAPEEPPVPVVAPALSVGGSRRRR